MASFVGNNGVIKLNSTWTKGSSTAPTGGTGTVVAELRNYSIDTTADTIETSVMGNDTRRYVKGMSTWSGSADVFWDPQHWDTTGMNPAGSGSFVGDATLVLAIYPEGDVSSSDRVMFGEIIVTGYSVTGSMDGLIEATVSFQGSGPLYYSAAG
jgi:hypothetical protein